jgi:hypothetical protein
MLLTTNAALIAGIALLIVWAAAGLPAASPPPPPQAEARRPDADNQGRETKPLEYYLTAAQTPLRKSLVEPPPAPAPARETSQPSVPLNVRLVGIAMDSDVAYGVFVDASGAEVLLAVGETVNEAELVRVSNDSVTMKHHNELVRLELPDREMFDAPRPQEPPAQRPPTVRRPIRRRITPGRPTGAPNE